MRPFRALFVGQLGIRKGLHHLLEAWRQLDLPDTELVLVGAPDKYGRELLRQYAGCYRWLGSVPHPELSQVYADSDCFVFPSLAEGWCIVVAEALASGLPCIISPQNGHAGLTVHDGVEGFVIPVGDVETLKDRIRRLYLDAGLRRQMGGAARTRAEHLSWQEFGRRLVLMYRTILSGERNSASDILDLTER